MKGLLLLFIELYTAGARELDKFVSPAIKSLRVAVEGVPKKVHSQGLEGRDLWEGQHGTFSKTKHGHEW